MSDNNDRQHVEEKTLIDKSKWRAGKDEPDRVEWRYKGVPCMLHRAPTTGAWCGYAGVPDNHPWFGKDENDVDASVHGGLTYASECSGHICHVPREGEAERLRTMFADLAHKTYETTEGVLGKKREPEAEHDPIWWLGFDCAHSGDFAPGMDVALRDAKVRFGSDDWLFEHDVYRDQAYAMAMTELLVEQILAAAQ